MTMAASTRIDPVLPPASELAAPPAPAHSATVMRQTQAVIGIAILAGLGAGAFAHEAWLIVPAIVGVGLLVAGATGVCPMAMFLARMPWNRRPAAPAHACCSGACR